MKENTFFDNVNGEKLSLDEIARVGAQEMLRVALESEITIYLSSVSNLKLSGGRQAIVRNGSHRSRLITVGSGSVGVSVPRTRNRDGSGENFVSSIVPPYMRRSLKIDEAIPLLYLRGLSTGDILPCLQKLLGESVSGLSPANISRLKSGWEHEYTEWQKRDLSAKQYCYMWVDGIHFNVRFSDNRICVLVVIAATEAGKKELVAVASGYRESKESWLYVMRDLKERGLSSPMLAIGDGALGFWAALPDIYPTCRVQRCWVHKTSNVLDKMPKHVQGRAKSMIHDIYLAESRKDAEKAFDVFINTFEEKYTGAVDCLTKDRESLLTFYDFPAFHWKHIRTTNTIESPFSTVRLRTDKTRGQGTESTTHMMVFKLLEQAEKRWQKLAGSNLIPLVLQGKEFVDGELKEAA
jgi:putative transposase